MKKQLLGVALSALMFAAAAEAKSFDGGFAGVNVGYKASKAQVKDTTRDNKANLSLSGVTGEVTGGYGETVGSVYLGGDVRLGHGWASKNKTQPTLTVKIKDSWNAGVGALIGGEFSNDCLAFFRLGLDYTNYKITAKINGNNSVSKNLKAWAVVPGIGLKWKVNQDWYVTGMYEYSHKFATKKFSNFKVDNLTSHAIKAGVGYQF